MDIGVLFNALLKLAADPNDQVLLSRFTGNYIDVLTLPLIPILHRECEYAVPAGKDSRGTDPVQATSWKKETSTPLFR